MVSVEGLRLIEPVRRLLDHDLAANRKHLPGVDGDARVIPGEETVYLHPEPKPETIPSDRAGRMLVLTIEGAYGMASEQTEHVTITKLRDLIRDVPDFPKPGVVFKDITPLLRHPAGLSLAVEYLTQPFREQHVDVVVGAESRGFIFATAVARNLSAGFVPIRKPGKLPAETSVAEYELEYGTDKMEVHLDAVQAGDRVLMVDDLLATGGTMAACCQLVEELGGRIVGCAFLIELAFLGGRSKLGQYPIHSILRYESE